MQKIYEILNQCINTCIKDGILTCVYKDNEIDVISLYLIFNKSSDLSILIKLIEKHYTICHYKQTELSLFIILENGINIYFHKANSIYNLKNINILYNPNNLKASSDFDEFSSLAIIKAITLFSESIHNSYLKKENQQLAINHLYKANEACLVFLATLFTKIPHEVDFGIFLGNPLEFLDKEYLDRYHKIIKLLKNESSISECCLLFIWFMDDFINKIPISICYEVNIDYYLYVKSLVAKRN